MKYVVFLCDGMADYKVDSLGNKTPMEAANKPNMDKYAKMGIMGMVKTVPDNMSPGSDVANLSVMGYDPDIYYTGRSPLEAASIGVKLNDNETSFRANLVTLSGDGEYGDLTMQDYSAGEIRTVDSKKIIEDLKNVINDETTALYSGVAYRHLLVLKDKKLSGELTAPHDISKKPIKDYLPKDEQILSIMKKSYEFLKTHPYNLSRIAQGEKAASSLWIWGEGKRPTMDSFMEKFQKKGSVISAVDLIKGIGILTGLNSIDVPDVTGNIDTNFEGKAQACIDALKNGDDFVYLHMEAPDECGHRFEADNKKLAIEYIDDLVIKPIMQYLENCNDDFSIMVLPDHPTPVSTGTHARGEVPFFIYTNGMQNSGMVYTEDNAKKTGIIVPKGDLLMGKFLNSDLTF